MLISTLNYLTSREIGPVLPRKISGNSQLHSKAKKISSIIQRIFPRFRSNYLPLEKTSSDHFPRAELYSTKSFKASKELIKPQVSSPKISQVEPLQKNSLTAKYKRPLPRTQMNVTSPGESDSATANHKPSKELIKLQVSSARSSPVELLQKNNLTAKYKLQIPLTQISVTSSGESNSAIAKQSRKIAEAAAEEFNQSEYAHTMGWQDTTYEFVNWEDLVEPQFRHFYTRKTP